MTTPITPEDTIRVDELTAIAELACRAPSLHNSQPWRWVFDHGRLHLFADHDRVARHTDTTGSEVLMSCGAALDHLRIAAAAAGWHTTIARFPRPHDSDHLATIAFRSAEHVDEHDGALGDAILQRRTDRFAFTAPEPWADLEATLLAALADTPVKMNVIGDDGRPALADASRRSEEHRRNDASYRYELLWWTHHSDSTEGIPPTALPSPAQAAQIDVARDFPTYDNDSLTPVVQRDHSKILILSTYDDSQENVLSCGEALSRVLLECTTAGFATCTLTHMMEVHASREIVRRLVGIHRSEPQVLIRVGGKTDLVSPAVFTRRRPIAEVLEVI